MLLRPLLPSARRAFLPGLGQILKGETRRTQQWQRMVPHRTATIFQAVAEVQEYSSFLPWCLDSRVLSHHGDEHTGESELNTEITVGYNTLRSTFASHVHIMPMKRVHAESKANEYIEQLSFTWGFRSIGKRNTRLDLKLDFCLHNPEHLLMWDMVRGPLASCGSWPA